MAKRHRKGSRDAGSSAAGQQNVPQGGESDPAELVEFIEYLSNEIFSAFPLEARTLSYSAIQHDSSLAETYSDPLTLSIRETLLNSLPPTVTDTLTAYTLITPPKTDLLTFLTPVLTTYISSTTSNPAPSSWQSTRPSACEICDRDWVPLSYHHLIPKEVHTKALKRGWHEEHMLNKVAWLCRACHSFVHRMAGNEELAREWHEIGMILEREDVGRWKGWVGGVRWRKR